MSSRPVRKSLCYLPLPRLAVRLQHQSSRRS
ncbi:hypothetical protein CGCVW01_v000588 [Colletotrichum viniferum]|nr:hypothetical protein CGCVW01_v000588 [Colletotrichum viniferum]